MALAAIACGMIEQMRWVAPRRENIGYVVTWDRFHRAIEISEADVQTRLRALPAAYREGAVVIEVSTHDSPGWMASTHLPGRRFGVWDHRTGYVQP